jgi:hypothetical protein
VHSNVAIALQAQLEDKKYVVEKETKEQDGVLKKRQEELKSLQTSRRKIGNLAST